VYTMLVILTAADSSGPSNVKGHSTACMQT
jgi:hypothetical protein